MHRNTWKAFERRIALFFSTSRTPMTGSTSRHTSADIIDDYLYLECKSNKSPALTPVSSQIVISQAADQPDLAIIGGKDLVGFLLGGRLKRVKHQERKNDAIRSLFIDTSEKAHREEKIPILALKLYQKHGFWFVIAYDELKRMKSRYWKSAKLSKVINGKSDLPNARDLPDGAILIPRTYPLIDPILDLEIEARQKAGEEVCKIRYNDGMVEKTTLWLPRMEKWEWRIWNK